jgi:hypothetical protein
MAATSSDSLQVFRDGTVIPAHPLVLNAARRLDERRQQALTRYYLDAGAGGLAVAVHTTQFAIHEPARGLLAPVLELAATTAAERPGRSPVLVAGVCGPTAQAVAEAELAARLGYHLVLLTPYGAGELTDEQLLDRARAVGEVLPVVGFYLQPAVGGRVLTRAFWRELADIPSVVGIKVAPFDRYATLDVIGGLAESSRRNDVTLYTGNDDHIIGDLIATYPIRQRSTRRRSGPPDGDPPDDGLAFAGGLLGQWALWTRNAVDLLDLARKAKAGDDQALRQLMELDAPLTDANAAIFDVRNAFHGCIPGIHEVLRRQGLLTGIWCLDETETLGPVQQAEIDRIWAAYPHLRDDDFIAENLDRWLT